MFATTMIADIKANMRRTSLCRRRSQQSQPAAAQTKGARIRVGVVMPSQIGGE